MIQFNPIEDAEFICTYFKFYHHDNACLKVSHVNWLAEGMYGSTVNIWLRLGSKYSFRFFEEPTLCNYIAHVVGQTLDENRWKKTP